MNRQLISPLAIIMLLTSSLPINSKITTTNIICGAGTFIISCAGAYYFTGESWQKEQDALVNSCISLTERYLTLNENDSDEEVQRKFVEAAHNPNYHKDLHNIVFKRKLNNQELKLFNSKIKHIQKRYILHSNEPARAGDFETAETYISIATLLQIMLQHANSNPFTHAALEDNMRKQLEAKQLYINKSDNQHA